MFAPNRSMNMKIHRNLMLVCLLLMASISYAQSETIVVGKKADGTDLKAQCYTFPQRVETFSMSDKGDYLCVSFRETTKSGKYLKNKGEIGKSAARYHCSVKKQERRDGKPVYFRYMWTIHWDWS